MRAITKNVYLEDSFTGVVVGVINLPHGLIQIDAPPLAEDVRAWRASLLSLGGGTDRMLVNLDAHPDRTIGARAMDCTVAAHEKVAQIFRNRSTTFKAQGSETGADWETLGGLGNIRWAPPEITFSHQMTIHWGGEPVRCEYHPGPSAGAAWVVWEAEKVAFIGDAVLKNQPPYLASADIPAWLETLQLLLSPAYRGWTVISGRSGPVTMEVIRAQREFLEHTLEKLETLAAGKAAPEAVEDLVPSLLGQFKAPASRQRQYLHRLRHGLARYYTRHYHPGSLGGEE